MPKKIEGGSDNWRTPQVLWDTLHAQYGFTIDLCASDKDAKTNLFTNNLEKFVQAGEFSGDTVAWINPPFSLARKLIPIAISLPFPIVGIYRSDNQEGGVWQDHLFQKADWFFYLKSRVKYEDPFGTRKSPMFPSVLWGKGVPPPKGLYGQCLINNNNV
jgi:hypothetical protein